MKLFRPSMRISFQIGDAVFTVSPLTYEQRIEAQEIIAEASSGDTLNTKGIYKSSLFILRHALKDVSGIDDFELKFENGIVTEESAIELLYAEESDDIFTSCNKLGKGQVYGLPTGVKIIDPKKKKDKKK